LDEMRTKIRRALLEGLGLKKVQRAGWRRVGLTGVESVAAHSWGVAWLVLALCPSALDRGRALAIAVIHDLAEVQVGDITPHDGISKSEKQARETHALQRMLRGLPHASHLEDLWLDYEEGRSAEARLVRACDKLDMALQAQLYAHEQGVDTGEFIASALAALTDSELRVLVEEVPDSSGQG